MTDFLVKLGQQPLARKAIKSLGLPIPLPQSLRRARGTYTAEPLAGMKICVETHAQSALSATLNAVLKSAGAEISLYPSGSSNKEKYDALVFDGSLLESPEDLHKLYDFYHSMLRSLAPCGRILIVARPAQSAASPKAAATMRALTGFVKSLGKEVGKRGATAQVLYVEKGGEGHLAAPLGFFLSPRASFISGQAVTVSNPIAASSQNFHSKPLAGKNALVTGALRGIGRAIAVELAAEGAKVFAVDLDKDLAELEVFAKEISGVAVGLNIMDKSAPAKILELVKQQDGLDILVHNAGVTRDKTLQNMSPEWWDQTIGINLNAVVEITAALMSGGFNKNARIVCMASIGGIGGVFGQTNYGASKAGIIGYVRALAKQIAASGMTVNAIAPGFIETRMTQAMPFTVREVGRRFNALSQAGLPEDVAELATFLCLPEASGVNGQIIRVCGLNILGA